MSSANTKTSIAVIVAGLLVVAGGVYVILEGSGNVAGNACAASVARAAALNGANTGSVAAFVPLDKPVDAGSLSFEAGDGSHKTLSDWKGRVVLLNLWATWCAPCREEMPALQALQKELGGIDFEVVPVSVDLGSADKPKKFYAENDLLALGFFHDGSMGVFNVLKKQSLAFGMPTTLLIDRSGCVLGSLSGPADWASQEAKALVKRAIAGERS